MKKVLILTTALIISLITFVSQAQEKKDTTVVFNEKKIFIQDSIGQMKVQIMDKDSNEYKKVYEGIFTDDKTFERFNVIEEIGFNVPFLKKKKKGTMEPHWAGFGFGKLTLADSKMNIGETGGVPLDKGKSSEIMFNIMEGILPVFNHTFGITSGFGLDWRNFHLENNSHFLEEDNVTGVYPAPAGVDYTYSRLRTLHLTIPLLLEWQPMFGNNHKFYVSGGVVGGWNVKSTYRIKYKSAEGDKINKVESHGLNTNPLTLDIMAQIGYSDISVYAKYSPVGVFQKDKGPEINAASLGLIIHF
ncbi:conserved exported hypothetical protein [uncultured Paludibacter sp.]|uniref:Uncharacterized protein n=1 Tax=uncultured Paludibacter sp. TaxID=497635 RepID=A0A653A9Q0_9BACT|nr:conserved exported hypothetical protein [uncultured Paludibacter sp.]